MSYDCFVVWSFWDEYFGEHVNLIRFAWESIRTDLVVRRERLFICAFMLWREVFRERTLLCFFCTERFAQNQQNLSTLNKPSVTITSPGSPGTIHTHPYAQQNCGKMQVSLGPSLCVCVCVRKCLLIHDYYFDCYSTVVFIVLLFLFLFSVSFLVVGSGL